MILSLDLNLIYFYNSGFIKVKKRFLNIVRCFILMGRLDICSEYYNLLFYTLQSNFSEIKLPIHNYFLM